MTCSEGIHAACNENVKLLTDRFLLYKKICVPFGISALLNLFEFFVTVSYCVFSVVAVVTVVKFAGDDGRCARKTYATILAFYIIFFRFTLTISYF